MYLEYPDQPSGNAQIEFVDCTTTPSLSCSAPTAINATSTGQEFFPAISVDSNGVIDTSWFDTRNSPNNTADFDVYAALDMTLPGIVSEASFYEGGAWKAVPNPRLLDAGVGGDARLQGDVHLDRAAAELVDDGDGRSLGDLVDEEKPRIKTGAQRGMGDVDKMLSDTLAGMMTAAGFGNVRYYNLTGGIVALHVGHAL